MGKKRKTIHGKSNSGKGNSRNNPAGKDNAPGKVSPVIVIDGDCWNDIDISSFLERIPENCGASFIINHTDHSDSRRIGKLLRKHTGLEIMEVKERTRIDNDRIYVIPPEKSFSIRDRVIHIDPGKPENVRATGDASANLHIRSDLLSRINDAVISVDMDKKITFFNPAAEKLYDMKADYAIGNRIDDILSYRFLSGEEKENAYAALERKGYWKGENIHITAGGKRLYVESSVSAARDGEGNITGMQAIIHDITERKELEISLQEKDKLLTSALSSAGMFAFEWDPETDKVTRTRNCTDILGIKSNPTGSTSKRYFRRIHPEDRGSFEKLIGDLTPENPNYSVSYRIKREDTGEYITIGEKGEGYFDDSGRLTGLSGLAADITLRKSLENELERQKELFQKVVNTIPVMITIYDPRLETFWFNREMERVLGWTEEDASERDFMKMVYPDDEYRKKVIEFMRSLEPGWRDFEVTAKNGSLVESTWSNIRLSDERQVGIGIDIRKHKEAERILTRDKKRLEKLVKEKSREMLEIQKETDREKRLADIGELAASVAHELRNPLGTINISIYNLRNKIKDKNLYKHLDHIKKKVEESKQTIDNLLSYSRRREPGLKRINICDKLKEVIEDSRTRKRHRNYKLQLDIDPIKDTVIEADPIQISEVFFNIMNNACNAIEDENGKILIKARKKNDNVEISFSDNGKGIEHKLLDRIFDPFFSTTPGGTGLGLPICRRIIRKHGGSINISSRKGAGTDVTISLPVAA